MSRAGLVGGELQGRVQRRPARDQLPLRAGAADRRRALDLQDRRRRRSPPRRAWRSRSWPSTTSARAPRATSTCRVRGPATTPGFERFMAGQLACLRELTLFYAPNINSYKRFARGLVRADRGRLGPRQPHLRGARGRPRRLAAVRAAAAGRGRQPVPGARRDDRRRAARARRASWSSSRRSRATPTWPTSRTCRRTLPRRASCSRAATSPARRSARRSSRTTSTTPRRARGLRGRRHRLGASTGVRAAVIADTPLRAGPVHDRVRGDAGAPRHRDQARAAGAGHAAARRARPVRAARDRPLDAAPGADRARPVRPPARGARPRRRDVRGRGAAGARPAPGGARRLARPLRRAARGRAGRRRAGRRARRGGGVERARRARRRDGARSTTSPSTGAPTCASTSGSPRRPARPRSWRR